MNLIKSPTTEHLEIDGVKLTDHPRDEGKIFPDGEVYIQLEELEKEKVKIIHSGMPDPNTSMMYLYGILELLKERSIESELFFTYFPYSMQDNEFHEGNLNYARAILRKLTEYYGVQKIYVLDPHFSQKKWVEDFPMEMVSAVPLIMDQLKEEYTVVGPDVGAGERFDLPAFNKKRKNSRNVSLSDLESLEDISGNILVLDDLIETGGTMSAAYQKIKSKDGVEKVAAAAIHGVMEEGTQGVKNPMTSYS
jgi:phosphoribosylpyrophosphate synthetase